MSFDYNELASTASEMLVEFGKAATLKRIVTGAYDPSTGTAPVTTTSLNTNAAVFAYDQKYIDGTLIKQGDQLAYLDPNVEPKQGDKLAWQGKDYVIVAVKPVAPAGLAVIFEAQIRG